MAGRVNPTTVAFLASIAKYGVTCERLPTAKSAASPSQTLPIQYAPIRNCLTLEISWNLHQFKG